MSLLKKSSILVVSKSVTKFATIFVMNGTTHFKQCRHLLDTNISFYLEASGGHNSQLYLNIVHFFNTTINKTSVAA